MKTPGFNIFFGVIALVVTSIGMAEARQAPAVTVTPLDGVLVATSINDKGQLLTASLIDDKAHTFVWTDGVARDITADCDCDGAVGYDISNTGQVVGIRLLADGSQGAFSWKDGEWTNLGTPDGAYLSIAWAVNDAGQIAGVSFSMQSGSVGTYWESSASAPAVTQSALIMDINNHGQMAGALADLTTCMTTKAVIEQAGQVTSVGGDCLAQSFAYAINDAGSVAVAIQSANSTQTALFKGAERIDLPPGGDFVNAAPGRGGINAASDVAGTSAADFSTSGGCRQQATVWLREGHMLLPGIEPDANGCFESATYTINIHGQVPGILNGQAVLWHVDIDRFAPTVTATATPVKPAKGGAPMLFSGRVVDEVHGPSSASGVLTATYRVVDEYGLIQPSGDLPLSANGEFAMTLPLEQVKGGDKDGRRYTIEITTTDRAGNSATSTTTLIVKHGPAK